jgi:glycosyltransferase involved in cell wall biosynthesis
MVREKRTFNILHVLGTLKVGGVQKYLLNLISTPKLNKYNHQLLCTISNDGELKAKYEERGIKINFLPFTLPRKSYLPFRVDKFIRRFYLNFYFFRFWYFQLKSKPDIIHLHISGLIISQIIASVLSRNKIIWTIHGEYKLSRMTLLILGLLEVVIPSKIFIITADSKAAFNSTLYIGKFEKNIIPTGINPLHYQLPRHNKLKKKLKLPNNTILIGSTGRIVWQKGYELIIDMLSKFSFNKSKVHFVIAGDGDLYLHLTKILKEANLENHVTFIGRITKISEFLSGLDFYVQPSVTEGFPLSVLEAMAARVPVICSDAGGLKEMVEDRKTGFQFLSENVESLHNTIQSVISLPREEVAGIIQNAQNQVNDQYNINIIASRFNTFYTDRS